MSDIRVAQVAQEYPEIRAKAQTLVLKVMPPEGYPSVESAYKDTLEAVQRVKTNAWTWSDVDRLAQELALDFGGYGPLQPLLTNPDIIEVMVTGTRVTVEWGDGRVEKIQPSGFRDVDHVMQAIGRILLRSGRRLDESCPTVDTQIVMDNGALCRVHAVIPPVAVKGPYLTIRKFRQGMNPAAYLKTHALTVEALAFLERAVVSRLNVAISGGTSSGKTTLLNVTGHLIPGTERIVTIEDALELDLPQEDVLPLLTRRANTEGVGELSIRQLVKEALRMRPDRIAVGEVRGGEALDMLQAMNTGHEGSLTTFHANSAADCLSRLETMVLMAGMDLPLPAIRSQIASALDLIVQVMRTPSKRRRVVEIVSMDGLDKQGGYILTPLFRVVGDKDSGELRPVALDIALPCRAVQKLIERGQEEVIRACFQ